MLFLSSDKSNKTSFYFKLLIKNLQLEEFKDLQIVSVNPLMQSALKLETVPLYLDTLGRSLISVQQITRNLSDMVRLSPVLLGRSESEVSSVLKWMELDYELR